MTLKIDTDHKVISIVGKVHIEDLLIYLQNNNMMDWSIESEERIHIVEKQTPSIIPPTSNIPFVYIPETDPYRPPYIVTCSTYPE